MTTSTLTLAEFLLARIDEDEAAAEKVNARKLLRLGPERADMAIDAYVKQFEPHRMLAECRAKRDMVKDFAPEIEQRNGYGAAAQHALLHLAQPYASHPDFRDEWRA